MGNCFSEIVEELHKEYRIQIEVIGVKSNEEFVEKIKEVGKLSNQELVQLWPFGAVYLPPEGCKDKKAHILVDMSVMPNSSLKDFLTHEFSNHVAWTRWAKELQKAYEKINKFFLRRGEYFQKRYPETEKKGHPFQKIERYYTIFSLPAISDSVKSVLSDYITIEKGFLDRLISRKNKIIKGVTKEIMNDERVRYGMFGLFPYLAYLTFSPVREVEPQFETELTLYFKKENQKNWYLKEVRKLKDCFREISIPVEAENFFDCFKKVERISLLHFQARIRDPQLKKWVRKITAYR